MKEEITNAELMRWLTRIERKIDDVIGDHEHRLRRVERVMYMTAGIALAGMGTGASSLIYTIIGGAS